MVAAPATAFRHGLVRGAGQQGQSRDNRRDSIVRSARQALGARRPRQQPQRFSILPRAPSQRARTT